MPRKAGRPMRRDKRSGHERVLAAVKHSLAEGRYEGGMLPSYRELVRNLNVTMASVRRAMTELEREGIIRREKGRGAFARTSRRSARAGKRLPLKSISFLQRWFSSLPSFVESDYLAGYTEALDNLSVPVRTRFVAANELVSINKRVFWPLLPIEAQAVVLINSCPPEFLEWLGHHKVPFVIQYHARYAVGNLPPHSGVYVNKSGGASQAVNHLLQLGHRKIGFMGNIRLSVSPDQFIEKYRGTMFEGYRMATSEGERAAVFEGYHAALACAGLGYTPNDVAHCDTPDKRKMFDIAKAFLNRSQRPTAIVTSCDEHALSLLEAAHTLNLRVPEDVSIVGFDNQPGSEQSDPPLTTVSVPRRELAQEAVKLLLEVAEDSSVSPKTRILDTHLIIRESTAPPKAARPNS